MLSNSAALSSMVAPFSAWSLTAIAERAAWWRAVRRNCGHKAKRRSVASIPASSSWRTSWSVPHRASPPQCRLGWRSLDKKTSRVSRGRASCAPIHSRVRTFPKIKSTQTSRRPCIRSIEESPPSRRPRPLSSNSNAQATPGPRSAKSDSRRLCRHSPLLSASYYAAHEGYMSDDFRKVHGRSSRSATPLTATSSTGRTRRARPRRRPSEGGPRDNPTTSQARALP